MGFCGDWGQGEINHPAVMTQKMEAKQILPFDFTETAENQDINSHVLLFLCCTRSPEEQ